MQSVVSSECLIADSAGEIGEKKFTYLGVINKMVINIIIIGHTINL